MFGFWGAQKNPSLITKIEGDKYLYRIKLLPNGQAITLVKDKAIQIWDLESYKCISKIEGLDANSCGLVVLSNSLIATVVNHHIHIHDIINNERIAVLSGHTDDIQDFKLLSDDRLISGSLDKTIHIWDLNTYQCMRVIQADVKISSLVPLSNEYCAIGAARENQYCTASTEKDIRILSLVDNSVVSILKGHTDNVNSLQGLLNGCFASISYDKTIRIWQPSSNKQIGQYKCKAIMKGPETDFMGCKFYLITI